MEDVARLQAEAGWDVEFFGMRHPENEPRRFEAWFPAHVELDPAPGSALGKAAAAARMVWSRAAERGMDAVLDQFRPDVVHLHNIYHQLSPSILRPVARRGIPAVMTLHDYKLICPSYQLLDHGQLCEACLGGQFRHAVQRRCKEGSLGSSLAVAVELSLHTRLGAYRPVDLFVCPSRFLHDKMVQGAAFVDRLRRIPHFVECGGIPIKPAPGGGVVFAGRLSPEKGVDVLVRAMALLPDVHLDVAGDGPEAPALRALAREIAPGQVRFHGRLDRPRLLELVRGASLVAVPSRWYENQPMSVLEGFACGLPVVGSDLGGIPELIEPGVDGVLVAHDDPAAWAAAISRLTADPARAFAMGRAARAKVEMELGPQVHLSRLADLYDEAAIRAHGSRSVHPWPHDGSRGGAATRHG